MGKLFLTEKVFRHCKMLQGNALSPGHQVSGNYQPIKKTRGYATWRPGSEHGPQLMTGLNLVSLFHISKSMTPF